ncbi:hypothetical protein NFI96_003642, partial [Prochilodus magdalenae]
MRAEFIYTEAYFIESIFTWCFCVTIMVSHSKPVNQHRAVQYGVENACLEYGGVVRVWSLGGVFSVVYRVVVIVVCSSPTDPSKVQRLLGADEFRSDPAHWANPIRNQFSRLNDHIPALEDTNTPGQVGDCDVTGYPGGQVMIYCTDTDYGIAEKYFCKLQQNQCLNKVVTTPNRWTNTERLSLSDSPRQFVVTFRNLSLQDAGLYQCGETGVWNHTVNLTLNSDPCCGGSKTVTGYLGETVTINCPYPEQFESKLKVLYKLDRQYFTELISTTDSQRDRFSISDNRSSDVLSVRISDVREDDGGVYYCAVWISGGPVGYFSLYTETQLDVM